MANATVTVLEADGVTETDVIVLDVGRQAAAASKSVALATEDKAAIGAATDDKSTATDTTSVSMISLLKQVSASIQALAAVIDTGRLEVFLDPATVNGNGRAAEADSAPVALSDEDFASLQAIETATEAAVGGLSVFRSLDLDESEEQAKATPGKLYKLRMTNFATSTRYVKIYNDTAANVTVGTTTPIDTIVLPAASSGDACVVTENFGGKGLTFDTALTLAATTALADNDTGAPGANEVVVSAYYE